MMKQLCISTVILFVMSFYMNCSPSKKQPHDTGGEESSQTTLPSQNDSEAKDINVLKEPRPKKICGQPGYEYLMNEYITEHCIGCHAQGGLVPPELAARDKTLAFNEALFVGKDIFLESVTKNPLCGDCNLEEGGEVFNAIEEWLDSRFATCP